jgi:hypothetical protein
MSDLGTTSESNDPGVNQSNENIVEADEESSSPAVDQSVVDVVGSSDPEVAAENEGDDSTEVVDESDVGESVHRTEVERLKVSVDHVDDITYALAYNRAPVIRRITITNELGGLSGPLTVTASLKWSVSEDSPSLPFSTVIELPGFGDSIALDTLDFRLDDAVMVNVNETAPARLEIQIVDALG